MDYCKAYDCDGVFADVLKPDKFEGASPKTVDALLLILANDDIP